jgi:hypothetical protein
VTVIPPTPASTAGSPALRVPLSLKSSNTDPVTGAAAAIAGSASSTALTASSAAHQ